MGEIRELLAYLICAFRRLRFFELHFSVNVLRHII